MAQKKTKQQTKAAPKRTGHARHVRKPGWLRKAVAQTFTSMLAPLIVGLTLQGFQGHVRPSITPTPRPAATTPANSTPTTLPPATESRSHADGQRDLTRCGAPDNRTTGDANPKTF